MKAIITNPAPFRDSSIRWKLTFIIVIVSVWSFLLAGAFLLWDARSTFKQTLLEDITILADVIGSNSTAALAFRDAEAAAETLAALHTDGHVLGGALYDAGGRLFADYVRAGANVTFPAGVPAQDQEAFEGEHAWIFRTVRLKDRALGRIYIVAETTQWYALMRHFAGVMALLFIGVLGLSLLLSLRLQSWITVPIAGLLDISRRVARERNYSIRALKHDNDEVGALVDGFNDMLDQIQQRRLEVERAQDELQRRVEDLAREVAERKRAEAELRQSREELADFVENASVGMHWVGPDGIVIWANRHELEMLGYTKDEYVGHHITEFHVDQPVIDEILKCLLRNETLSNYEARLRCKDGSIRYGLINSNAYLENGKFVHTRCFTRDITERKAAEEALRESEERYRSLVAATTSVVWTADPSGRFTEPQTSWQIYTGQAPQDHANFGWLAALHPDDREPVKHAWVEGFAAGVPFEIEARIWHAISGRHHYCSARAVPLRAADGAVREWIGTVSDIDDRQRAEEKFRLAVEAAPNGMMIIDTNGTIALINQQLEKMFGYGRDELVGKPVEVLLPLSDRTPHVAHRDQFFRDPQARTMGAGRDLYGRRKDGRPVAVEIGLNPFVAQDGVFCLASIIDITERKRAEQELKRYNEELQRSNHELGQFAYVASHDLQEPLRAVSGCAQLLQQRYQSKLDARADELINHAVTGAARMQALINDLLVYSRVGTRGKPFETCDCSGPLKEALANLDVAIREAGAVITHDAMPRVTGDQTQLTQLFQNLVGNALKFRGDRRPEIHVSVEQKSSGYLFAVRDNGIGIEPQYFERVFGVFQRLHNRREYPGNGIGLAICRKIVERHQGRMWVDSVPGRGSVFYFTIPIGGAQHEQHERYNQRQ